jgi:hypothetical protein
MKKRMQVIQHHRFGNLRCLVVDGEPYFCAKDLAAVCPQVEVYNERQLHDEVVKHLRSHHKGVRVTPGLGEIQVSVNAGGAVVADRRLEAWSKGYMKGQPDLIIHQRSGNFSGLAIELKSPTGRGVVSAEQQKWLDDMRLAGYRAAVCDDLQETIELIDEFLRKARVCCQHCGNSFKTRKNLERHSEKIHPNAV